MGSGESKCVELLERMGWQRPDYIGDFFNPSLAEYLEFQNLEVVLPQHAPQCDVSMADRKPAMYPRPNFCWEAYKMHLALIGPSTACRNQLTAFLPKIADVFQGPSSRLGPGREAVPYHFLDDQLHRIVLWDLPEISWKQTPEDYIRELGLLYIDCVFMLFSDKYTVTDIYAKLCVAMHLHGIPFFVLCTMSGDTVDEQSWRRLKGEFQKQGIMVRMFDPKNPHEMLGELISDFVKEVRWSRSKTDAELTKDIREDVLGQTVRLKNIEKRPELNGKCGVCIGRDPVTSRYRVRIILEGVETDLALKQDCLSVLKPKLLREVVRVKGLESKPELNGRYGFVDEFLRENERYRVFIPDKPGQAFALALKPANLERVDSVRDAAPASTQSGPQRAPGTPVAKAKAAVAAGPAGGAPPATAATRGQAATGEVRGNQVKAADRPASAAAPGASAGPSAWRGPVPTPPANRPWRQEDRQDDPLDALLPERQAATSAGSQHTPGTAAEREAEAEAPATAGAAPPAEPQLRLSRQGLLASRVWAVAGDSEEVVDHLMDCGKTVFCIGKGDGAQFASPAELGRDPKLPRAEILAFVEGDGTAVEAAVEDALRLGLRGILLHPVAAPYGSAVRRRCEEAGLLLHEADILQDVVPGAGIPVAPID